jgi:hypothetical protein
VLRLAKLGLDLRPSHPERNWANRAAELILCEGPFATAEPLRMAMATSTRKGARRRRLRVAWRAPLSGSTRDQHLAASAVLSRAQVRRRSKFRESAAILSTQPVTVPEVRGVFITIR